jgi:hypothetical protein
MAQPPGGVLARYNAMREAALVDAQERLFEKISGPRDVQVRLSLIDEPALRAWQKQWKPRPDCPGGWNWREQRLRLASNVSRFEVGLWSGPLLCGIAIGKPLKRPGHLVMQLLEGNPTDMHPLKGFVAGIGRHRKMKR